MTIKRLLACFLGALLLLATPFLINKPVKAQAYADSGGEIDISASAEFAPITTTAATPDFIKYVPVYDENNNQLFYHRQTKAVFNQKGEISYDDTSTPILYQNEKFTNGQNRELKTASRPATVGSGLYLTSGSYKVRSVSIDDTFYELPLKSGGTMYCTMLWIPRWDTGNVWQWLLGAASGTLYEGNYEPYNLLGHKQDESKFNCTFSNKASYGKLSVIGLPATFPAPKLLEKYPKATLKELLETIGIAVLDENGGNTNPSLNLNNIYDDTDHPIKIIDGQACDYMGFPLIGKDYKPILFNGSTFFGYDGRELTLTPHPTISGAKLLTDGDIIAHSVIAELRNDLLYFIYLSDGALCPVYGTPEKDADGYATGKVKFRYLNDEPVDNEEIVEPEISEEDIYERYPELKPPAWYEEIFGGIRDWFNNLFSGISGVLKTILIIVAILLLLPFIPYLLLAVKWIVKILLLAIKWIVKGIINLFKIIFKKENVY